MARPPDPRRRSLRFNDLDEVVRDVEDLQRRGYDRVGRWDLAQVCGHLSEWMGYAVDGYPKPPAVAGVVLALVRSTIGPSILKKILAKGSLDAGSPTMKQTVPPPSADPGPAIAELRRVVERFKGHGGEYCASLLFGPIGRDEMKRLQLIHCDLHLSFLLPHQA